MTGAAVDSFASANAGDEASVGVGITGVYGDGLVHVVSVTTLPVPTPTDFAEPKLPCRPPSEGWRPGYGLEAVTVPDTINELHRWVEGRSATYTDVWEGHVQDAGQARNVLVVGTTGEVGKAQVELAARYPGNLCVYQAKYSARDLQAIASRLREALSTRVEASVDPVANRVVVTPLALDPATTSVLGRFDSNALDIRQPLLLPADR